jgi:hypothetical protein
MLGACGMWNVDWHTVERRWMVMPREVSPLHTGTHLPCQPGTNTRAQLRTWDGPDARVGAAEGIAGDGDVAGADVSHLSHELLEQGALPCSAGGKGRHGGEGT